MNSDDEHLGLSPEEKTPDAYYVREDATHFRSTVHAQGAWNPHEQHMAPASGLLVHAVQHNHPRADVQIAEITFEILGLIHGGLVQVETEVVRPGRTIELIEARMSHGGRVAIRALVWRLIISDTAHVATSDFEALGLTRLPAPDQCAEHNGLDVWPGGFIRSLRSRVVAERGPGNATAWVSAKYPLVLDEPSDAVARFVGVVDAANGIAPREDPRDYLFPNVELSINFFRAPQEGEWVGLDTRVAWGATGLGLTSSVLSDIDGPVGRAAQSLTVRQARP